MSSQFPLSNRLYRKINSDSIFLTFDDGPNNEVTFSLLKILEKYNSTATFFVNGLSLRKPKSKQALEAIISNQNTLGNHGYFHFKYKSPRFDIMRKVLLNMCNIDTQLVRAPYGHKKLLIEYFQNNKNSIGFHWSVCFNDWEPIILKDIQKNLMQLLHPGNIILLHDGVIKSTYKDRNNVLILTELICEICRIKQIPLSGLSNQFPNHYTIFKKNK